LDFILEKGGSAYLPTSIVEPFIASGELNLIPGVEEWHRPVYLSYRKNSSTIEAIGHVEELVKKIDPLTAYSIQRAGEASL